MLHNCLISIVIVSYNTKDLTCSCISSVYQEALEKKFEVIVVDNDSSDGSADAIEIQFPQVKLIRSGDNLGFARANNLGALDAVGEYLLLLNPDTVVLDHAIDRLIEFATKFPDAKIWGGRTVFADGSLNPTSCWRFMSLWSLFAYATGLTMFFPNSPVFNREGYGGWLRDSEREIDIVTGCFLLLRRGFWNELNGLDESFFMYAEEADLCFRARDLGARPMFTPDATIIHIDGASERVFAGRAIRMLSGKAHFIHKHWSGLKKAAGITMLKLAVIVRMTMYGYAAAITKKDRQKENVSAWREVWSARQRWTNGYI